MLSFIYFMLFIHISAHLDTSPEWRNGVEYPAGKDGKSGTSKKDERPPTILSMISPYFAINAFKDYIRENLFKNIKESELRSFIHDLENDTYINAKYNTLVFVREFEGLENQYLKLNNNIDFAPFYDSLLIRIEKFAISETNRENKKVLSFIYTAALTKMFALKKRSKGKIVVDLRMYLNTIEQSINEIHETIHLQTVQNYRNEYNYTLTKKIQEANDFIKKKIEPEIDKLWEQSDNQMKAIINEIENNKNDTIDAIAELEKNKEKIRKIMLVQSILGPLKTAASCLSFLGPVGAAAGTVATSTLPIVEGLIIDKISGKEKDGSPPIDVSTKLTARVTNTFKKKPKQLADKLDTVVTQLKEYNDELLTTQEKKIENSQKIEDFEKEIRKIKNTEPQSIKDVDVMRKDVRKVEKEITEFTKIQNDILEKEKKLMADKTTEQKNLIQVKKEIQRSKSQQVIQKARTVIDTGNVVFSVVKQLKNGEEKIKKINKQIIKYNQQLRNLEQMENQIYEIVAPDLLQIEQTVNAIKTSVKGSSHAKLDVTKWTVRTTLKDVKSMLQKFTYKLSFKLRSDLERFIEKIDEAFSILIDIYDRIDAYHDSVKQAEYIAHIESAKMDNIQVTDAELSQAMIDLKLIIHSNILTEKYEIALHAFKQHYFPFAAHVLRRFQLPASLRLNDTETLRTNIINTIKDMKNHIDESEATLDEYSKLIHEKNVFNSNTTSSLPFYVWRYETIKDEIQRLLNGSEILIKADIVKGLYCNSVKYDDIGINFRLKNGTLQNSFTSVLKNFVLTMTMIGNNYYRCGERYYFISFDDDITISYTLDQDKSENWINPNRVYSSIHRSHPFLSPYGLWSIKLKKVNELVSWNQLRVYANETMDLDLIGRGYYIEQDPVFNFDICDEYLDKFYNVDNIVKELV